MADDADSHYERASVTAPGIKVRIGAPGERGTREYLDITLRLVSGAVMPTK